jgi:hypothetical protein
MNNFKSRIEQDIGLLLNQLDLLENEYSNKINEFREAARHLYKPEDLKNGFSPFLAFRESLQSFKNLLTTLDREKDRATAFRTLLAFHAIDSEGTAIEARLSLIGTTSAPTLASVPNTAQLLAQAWSQFWAKVKSVMGSIASNLWAFISQYLNLKEWSIKGSISTPAITQVFGLTGSAELQLTFEK